MILDSVILALLAAYRGAVPTGVNVHDGPVPSAVNSGDFVLVGSTALEGEDGAVVDLALSDMGPGTWHDEAGDVICSAFSWSGGTDVAARRAKALQLATSCADAVHADRTLGGLLTEPGLAQASEFRYLARQDAEGVLCRVTFSVTYSHLNT